MVSIVSLWLPILLSAVIVFIASSIIHMLLKYHRSDFGRVPSEDEVMDALRPFNIPPGDYVIPCAGKAKETDYLAVFRFAGCAAFLGYAMALLQNSIWYKRKWSATLKSMFDGLIYALLTAGTFGWLWPGTARKSASAERLYLFH